MPIKFTELFDTESTQRLGIRRRHAEDAITAYDNLHVIRFAGAVIELYSKTITLPHSQHMLLVQAFRQGNDLRVDLAFKIPMSVIEDLGNPTPLTVLERLTERFGAEVVVGATRSKLIVAVSIPVSPTLGAQVVSVPNRPVEGLLQGFTKVDSSSGTPVAHCALVYCLDTGAYLSALRVP